MTINIALASYDGIILGCDSLSSVVDQAIFPFRCTSARDAQGNELLDAHGSPLYSLSSGNLTPIATTVFGGVNKTPYTPLGQC